MGIDARIGNLRRRWKFIHHFADQHQMAIGRKRHLPREHGIGNYTQTVNIGASIQIQITLRLFGRHIGRRPDREAGHGDHRVVGRHLTRNAKIRNQRPAILGEEDVAGFHVSMQKALLMGIIQAGCHLLDDGQHLIERHRRFALFDLVRNRPARG